MGLPGEGVGGGGVGTPPVSRHVGCGCASAETLQYDPIRTLGTAPTASATPGMLVQIPLSASHTRHLTCHQVCGRSSIPCSLSFIGSYGDQTSWIFP